MPAGIPILNPLGRRTAQRLDQALVERGLCESREKAKRAILAGTVRVNGQTARKPSDTVRPGDTLTLDAPERYVSRGGHKLEHALAHFQLPVAGWTALDLGASTGGFTDCLLQHGAARVFAVDVGHGLMAWKLRNDPRVVVMERVNARHLTPASFKEAFQPVDLAVMDCSFISLTKILPAAAALVRPGGRIVALVKPQFEAGRREVGKGGIVREPAVHARVLREVEEAAAACGLVAAGSTPSPIEGADGNREFLLHLRQKE